MSSFTQVEAFNNPIDIYKELLENSNNNDEMLRILHSGCAALMRHPRMTPYDAIFKLRKRLMIDFPREVKCKKSNFCDLREIIYGDNEEPRNVMAEEILRMIRYSCPREMLHKIPHIMTDVDDTLFANTEHGTLIAGTDTSWHQKEAYPGIKQFYQEFYNTISDDKYKYTTILSATPRSKKDKRLNQTPVLTEILQNYDFIEGPMKGILSSPHLTIPSIITGFRRKAATFNPLGMSGFDEDEFDEDRGEMFSKPREFNERDITNLHKAFGVTKWKRYLQYKKLFPEYKIYFIGDTGQGDLIAAYDMTHGSSEGTRAFIHRVYENGNTVPMEVANKYIDTRKKRGTRIKKRLFLFNNYYQLARDFERLGVFDKVAVDNIKTSLVTDIEELGEKYSDFYPVTDLDDDLNGGRRRTKNRTKKRTNTKRRTKRRKISNKRTMRRKT